MNSVSSLLWIAPVFVLLWAWALGSIRSQVTLAPLASIATLGRLIIFVGIAVGATLSGITFRTRSTAIDEAIVQEQTETTAPLLSATEAPTTPEVNRGIILPELTVATSAATSTPRPVPQNRFSIDLRSFPKPAPDNGRGLHWFPTNHQDASVVDRFVPELVAMHIRWLTIIQGLEDYELDGNVYLVQRLVQSGIMPVMRIEARIGALDLQRFRRVVEHYRAQGVSYFQIFNEPNLPQEWADGRIESPVRFGALWQQAAEIVIAADGFPGIAAMSPNAPANDFDYLRGTLDWLGKTQRDDILRRTWLSVHNYTIGQPVNFIADDVGYGRYRQYAQISRQALGIVLPMIGTEGGPHISDTGQSRIIEATRHAQWIADAFQSLSSRESFWFAFTPWLIGNMAGGGIDSRWESAAWFKIDRIEPVVTAIRNLP
jgi:hypothetical protein